MVRIAGPLISTSRVSSYRHCLTAVRLLIAIMSGSDGTSGCPPILAHLILSNVSIGATMGVAYVGAVLSAMYVESFRYNPVLTVFIHLQGIWRYVLPNVLLFPI